MRNKRIGEDATRLSGWLNKCCISDCASLSFSVANANTQARKPTADWLHRDLVVSSQPLDYETDALLTELKLEPPNA